MSKVFGNGPGERVKGKVEEIRERSSGLPFTLLYFDLRPGPKILFKDDAPEGSDTFQWPLIERDRVGG